MAEIPRHRAGELREVGGMSANFTEITHVKKRRFLNAFVESGGVRRAAEQSDVSWGSHYHWLRDDPEYATAFAEARMMAGEMLENEAVRRAMQGSDTLLIFLLNGAMPDKYKRRTVYEGDPDKPIKIEVTADDLHEATKRAKGKIVG